MGTSEVRMRRYWGHAAMLLLGISLTVGFYEGRALVQNTAKVLTAATTITASDPTKRERRVDRERDEIRATEASRDGAPQPDRKRKGRRMVPLAEGEGQPPMFVPTAPIGLPEINRQKVELNRQRVRPRVGPNRKPVELPDKEVDEDLLDTGVLTGTADPAP